MSTKFFTLETLAIAMISSLLITQGAFAEEAADQAPTFLETVIADTAEEAPAEEAAETEEAAEEVKPAEEAPALPVADASIPAFTEDTPEEAAESGALAYDFDKIKLRPLVEKDADRGAIPDDVQKDFDERSTNLRQLIGEKNYDKAITIARQMIEDFSAQAHLARQAKRQLAWLLARDSSTQLEAIELYDELASMNAFSSSTVSQFLAAKENIQEQRREFEDANRTIMRQLEQPELTPGQRDDLKYKIVSNLIALKDYDTAKQLAIVLVGNENMAAAARVKIATLVGEYVRNYQHNAELETQLLKKVENLPLGKVDEWTKLERAHHLAYMYLNNNIDEKGPQLDKATEVLKAVYDDETLSFEPRWHAICSLLSIRNHLAKDDDPASLVNEANEFIEANKAKINQNQSNTVKCHCLATYVTRNLDTAEGQELAESICSDSDYPAKKRADAAVYLGDHFAKAGDKEKAEDYFRKALPLMKDNPWLLTGILSKIADLYSVDTDRDKIIAIYNEGTALNGSEEMENYVNAKIKALPAAPQPAAAPAPEASAE